MAQLDGKKVAIIVDDYFEQAEFTGPRDALNEAGVEVVVVSDNKELHGLYHVEVADSFAADKSLDEVTATDYDAVVLPGGVVNADHLRMNKKAADFVRAMFMANKPVAAICHAPWVLISSGIVKNHTLTSYFTIQDDLRNAGANWVDQEVVVDGNLITSRKPDDVPAFNRAIFQALGVSQKL
jgi:protease I